MDIHIFTGGKGGIGKTLCVVSSLIYLLKQSKNILVIDLNFNNPDLRTILNKLLEEKNIDIGLKSDIFLVTRQWIFPNPAISYFQFPPKQIAIACHKKRSKAPFFIRHQLAR